MSITYVIPGQPVAWKRAGRRKGGGFFDQQMNSKLGTGIFINNQHVGEMYKGPLLLDITFYFKIATTLSKKQKDFLLGNYHHTKPDLDNCIKYILDTCNTLLFDDDCTISKITACKLYDTDPRTEFTLTELK